MSNKVGMTGVVALDIEPPDAGKVTLLIAGTDEDLFARASTTIITGTKVLVVDVLDSNTVVVQPI